MIPDVTPNGVFYLPPTGWLTSFYNPPFFFCFFAGVRNRVLYRDIKRKSVFKSNSAINEIIILCLWFDKYVLEYFRNINNKL